VMPKLGVPVEPSRVESVDPWWRLVGAAREAERPVGAVDPAS